MQNYCVGYQQRHHGTNNDANFINKSSSSSSSMEVDGYRRQSFQQYTAHTSSANMLSACMERLALRINFQQQEEYRRYHIVDLGSADGSNSMKTLHTAVGELKQQLNLLPPNLHITFEEQPGSNVEKLKECLKSHEDWFRVNDITRSILLKSFYDQLFPPNSIDFSMSHICLHWLDNSDGNTTEWKILSEEKDITPLSSLTSFTFANETTAPISLRQQWKNNLADLHLAKFFALRANELRPGAEAFIVMVGRGGQQQQQQQHEGFVCPSDGGASPLTRAMLNCIEKGQLREEVLRRTVIPYFLRTADDVKDAFHLASKIELPNCSDNNNETTTTTTTTTTPGEFLELVDVQSFPTIIGGNTDNNRSVAELFWSIHSGAVVITGNPFMEELEYIKKETMLVFEDLFDPQKGIPITFVGCVIRRRTRRKG